MAVQRKACSRCGVEFSCGASDGACWCMQMPPVPAAEIKDQNDCLCPACLEQCGNKKASAPYPP
ncbi:MAG: hypothetical protein EOP11_13845, partial [Proteobacteria bacterium]